MARSVLLSLLTIEASYVSFRNVGKQLPLRYPTCRMKNHLDSVDFHFQDGEGSMGLDITITKSAKA
jgi:hypothetical protein